MLDQLIAGNPERIRCVPESLRNRDILRLDEEGVLLNLNFTPNKPLPPVMVRGAYAASKSESFARQIIKAVSEAYTVPEGVLLGKDRTRWASRPRWHAMYLIRLHCKWAAHRIGKLFNKDHTSVLYALKMFRKEFEDD